MADTPEDSTTTPPSFSTAVHVYDLKRKKWGERAPYPVPVQGIRIAAYAGYLYGFGGFTPEECIPDEPWSAKTIDRVYRYSISSDKWEPAGFMPRPRSSNVCAVIGEKAYLIGGWDATPTQIGDSGRFIKAIDVFDLGKGEFVRSGLSCEGSRLRRAFSATVWKDKIILAGGLGDQGFETSDLFSEVIAWTPPPTEFKPDTQQPGGYENGQWSLLPCLPTPLFSPGIGCWESDLIVAGGARPYRGGSSHTIYRLNSDCSSWIETKAQMSEAKSFVEIVPVNKKTTALIGGHHGQESDGLPSDMVEVIN